MESPQKLLRALVQGPGLTVVPQCYNPLTARIAQDVGFSAVYLGGHVVASMYFGLPDYGVVTMSEMIEVAARVTDGLSIPLICDADQAGETVLNVHRTVRSYERAGVAGIHIEDSVNPKHMGSGGSLIGVKAMQARLGAAVEARTDADFVIIARTDCLFNGGTVDETIERGIAYAEAGADMFMPIWMKPADMDRVADAIPIPLVDISHPRKDVEATKLRFDIITRFFFRATALAYEQQVIELRDAGEFANDGERMMTTARIAELTGEHEYEEISLRWRDADERSAS